MKRNLLVLAAVAAVGFATSAASAGTLVVNSFGAGGWTSWDTHDASGTQLVGTNDTNPFGATYFATSASSASDTAINKQIVFMGEGETVNNAAGNTPPISPTGSLNGKGYVRLDGTSNNSGKSDLSYVDTSGIGAASSLNDPSFSASYSFYGVSVPGSFISREPAFNISVIGTDGNQYTFAYTAPSYTANTWTTENLNSTTGSFKIYSNNGANGITGSLADLASNPTYGAIMFGAGSEIWRVGFNIGTSSHNGLDYIDSLQTNILNGGDVIDFQGPSAVPLPASAWSGLALLGGLGLFGAVKRHRKQMA